MLCNSVDHRYLKNEAGRSVLRCENCGLIFVFPRPSPGELRRSYEAGKARSVDPRAQQLLTLKKRLVAKADLSRILDHGIPESLLEIGSGAGVFLAEADKRGIEAFGVEVNQNLVDFGIREFGVRLTQGTIEDFRSPRDSFDVVYHRYLLSHLHEPVKDCRRLHTFLEPGGLMLFETGNVAELTDREVAGMELEVPDHLYFFSEGNVRQLLKQTGFRLISVQRYAMGVHEKVRHLLTSDGAQEGVPSSASGPKPGMLMQASSLLSYLLVYWIGRYLPHQGRFCSVKYLAERT